MCSIPHCLLARIDSARLAEGCLSGAIYAAAVPRCLCQVNIEAMIKHQAKPPSRGFFSVPAVS